MTGLLNPKSAEICLFFSARFSFYNLGHGDFSSSSDNFFNQISFLVGRSLISQIVEPQKNDGWCTYIVERVYARRPASARREPSLVPLPWGRLPSATAPAAPTAPPRESLVHVVPGVSEKSAVAGRAAMGQTSPRCRHPLLHSRPRVGLAHTAPGVRSKSATVGPASTVRASGCRRHRQPHSSPRVGLVDTTPSVSEKDISGSAAATQASLCPHHSLHSHRRCSPRRSSPCPYFSLYCMMA